jgi:hypothetical protein
MNSREAPWSSGEHRGLTVWAMVLGCEFNSLVRLKTRWIKWTTWWQKKGQKYKDRQKGQVTPKKIFFKRIWIPNENKLNNIKFWNVESDYRLLLHHLWREEMWGKMHSNFIRWSTFIKLVQKNSSQTINYFGQFKKEKKRCFHPKQWFSTLFWGLQNSNDVEWIWWRTMV